eukprot:CAMPEP_0185584962 /NCGR_PEP_ID=MMETSP0434-20130131/35594_1 /TAXON_ID=626734 ORGANISM="Favella taraikaensis, Strain Fe Narragansett Bay" /NCGR_SAMPLE_ID=MMETSP0434 /ASSEMBLY_ACC=CAM_ASM_000379 /LENGTH=66 /DNA_ID=CAMNT_0028205025 /DNA_START=2118 /DNA_END=2318 /DNA_ORIENTATION=-
MTDLSYEVSDDFDISSSKAAKATTEQVLLLNLPDVTLDSVDTTQGNGASNQENHNGEQLIETKKVV